MFLDSWLHGSNGAFGYCLRNRKFYMPFDAFIDFSFIFRIDPKNIRYWISTYLKFGLWLVFRIRKFVKERRWLFFSYDSHLLRRENEKAGIWEHFQNVIFILTYFQWSNLEYFFIVNAFGFLLDRGTEILKLCENNCRRDSHSCKNTLKLLCIIYLSEATLAKVEDNQGNEPISIFFNERFDAYALDAVIYTWDIKDVHCFR